MEHVLDVYQRPLDAREPVVCMDETTKQLTSEVIAPLAPQPGRPARYDTLYMRNGVGVIFMFFEPLAGWRRVSVAQGKTRRDWAHQVRRLLDEDYPAAKKVHLVLDNLNTHGAHRCMRRSRRQRRSACFRVWSFTTHPSTARG